MSPLRHNLVHGLVHRQTSELSKHHHPLLNKNRHQGKHVLLLCVFPQTITKVLLQYCALLAKSFPSFCEKEKIVSCCISSLCCQTGVNFLEAGAPSVKQINILAAAPLYNSETPISVVCSLFDSFIFLLSLFSALYYAIYTFIYLL